MSVRWQVSTKSQSARPLAPAAFSTLHARPPSPAGSTVISIQAGALGQDAACGIGLPPVPWEGMALQPVASLQICDLEAATSAEFEA